MGENSLIAFNLLQGFLAFCSVLFPYECDNFILIIDGDHLQKGCRLNLKPGAG